MKLRISFCLPLTKQTQKIAHIVFLFPEIFCLSLGRYLGNQPWITGKKMGRGHFQWRAFM